MDTEPREQPSKALIRCLIFTHVLPTFTILMRILKLVKLLISYVFLWYKMIVLIEIFMRAGIFMAEI